jgi:predicted dehydrogenase
MSNSYIRWGIMGAANIARKSWWAIGRSGNAMVTAVASREMDRARSFIAECQETTPMSALPVALGSYEELLACRDVDAVYIPLPTGIRKEWMLRSAAAGKHVLCEKPCATSAADLEEMIDACRTNNVQFMDGVKFMHGLRLTRMREALDDQVGVGPLRRITSALTFAATPTFLDRDIRLHSVLEPHGCLGDLGWYNIRYALWAMNWRMPNRVTGRIMASCGRADSPAPVATDFVGELFFDGGVSAAFHCSFVAAKQQWAIISGALGTLETPEFVNPPASDSVEFTVKGSQSRRVSVPESGDAQGINLFRVFSAQARSGSLNDYWPEIALKTQRVMNACYEAALAKG